MTEILSSFDAFADAFSNQSFAKGDSARHTALKRYFEKGGVMKLSPNGSNWPKVLYPAPERLRAQLDEANRIRNDLEKKRASWDKTRLSAKHHDFSLHMKKMVDPLYWQHQMKQLTDKDYRNDAARVALPTRLVSDKRYRPMMEMFVNNIDYRKQLAETVETSIVYKNSKIAKYAQERMGLRQEVSENQIEDLIGKIKEVDEDINMLKEMLNWAKS